MSNPAFSLVPEILKAALTQRGFTELTAVQQAVLQPEITGRDLRITSQTGSGKTVAMGMLLAQHLERVATDGSGVCQPRAIIVTPTRELATQVGEELGWLLKDAHARVMTVVGGTSVRFEQKTLSRGAEVVVGTPGRLLDHLNQHFIEPAHVHTVVLDEADQMLDLGFREELEAILERMPAQRRTHMVSATFSRPVLELARRYQQDALHVQGTTLGRSNEDITHVVHVVKPQEITDAVINLLLLVPDELTLVFVRTRADAASMAEHLLELGFNAAALTGEMEQAERTRVMKAFRSGALKVLVATDVAARGIDIPDITRVIQADAPKDPDIHTHRSGRTGRAGRKGTSIVLVPPVARGHLSMLLKRAGVKPVLAPVPDGAAILKANDDRLVAELTAPPAPASDTAWEPHLHALATRLLDEVEPLTLVHRLLARLGHHGTCPPRSITRIDFTPPAPRPERDPKARPPTGAKRLQGPWVRFCITCGSRFNMDARRLLATVCRRGKIRGADVGAIKIGTVNSTFDVLATVAQRFAEEAARPDPREPRIRIEPLRGAGEDFGEPRPAVTEEAPKPTRQTRKPHKKPRDDSGGRNPVRRRGVRPVGP